ncbi:hypothetical protein OESDEN_21307 [Oesophagostomum dentatum]|uniref:Resistance to inhibitors of cholinesterase protein 3 N-terminal domain-containing protein n=1 Tax=Oesophagostomum dentatum TaxID=61180 RepID=A0A0B1S6E9_OESDE|nr:hypothetical protein OESDEN_21307 [Oesophagostomum dentatum]
MLREVLGHLKTSIKAETQSGGRGMFTWMLPIYTVGVVIFLLYTLFKTKSKKKRRRYDSSEYSSDEGDEYNDRLKRKIGKRKLRGLQERLQQTEEAMNKILEQLEAVQAAGALAEGTQDQTEAQASEGKENSEPKAALNSKNDQYINDLEKALRDFKVLSDAYEEERGLRRKNSGTEDDTSTEELDSGSDEEDSEEEELPKEKKKRSAKARDDDSGEDVAKQIVMDALPMYTSSAMPSIENLCHSGLF